MPHGNPKPNQENSQYPYARQSIRTEHCVAFSQQTTLLGKLEAFSERLTLPRIIIILTITTAPFLLQNKILQFVIIAVVHHSKLTFLQAVWGSAFYATLEVIFPDMPAWFKTLFGYISLPRVKITNLNYHRENPVNSAEVLPLANMRNLYHRDAGVSL